MSPLRYYHTTRQLYSNTPFTKRLKSIIPISNPIPTTNFSTATASEPPPPPTHPHCPSCTCDILPAPKWSFYKRTLPIHLTPLSSPTGKQLFLQSLSTNHAESYFPLVEQFLTQSEPAYCGLSTLVMVLNALSIDPNIRWRGGWRWFDEDLLLRGCCLQRKDILQFGIVMEQFASMGRCYGARIEMKRPSQEFSLDCFRRDVIQTVGGDGGDDVDSSQSNVFCVASYSRAALMQTGDGHFSPIAAYHQQTDKVLILDVARFKYTPYWVSLKELYRAMTLRDPATEKPRGWFLIGANEGKSEVGEKKRPADCVEVRRDKCPVGEIKVMFCKAKDAVVPKRIK